MKGTYSPSQLPFVPKPLKAELFSSWLLRIAADNHVTARELMRGFTSIHPNIPLPASLDRSLNSAFLQPFSQFCRVHLCTLKALDLESRLKRPHRPVLLRFPARSKPSPRHCEIRAGYGFCPSCIAQDSIIHVRWDWCFAGLIRCPIHDIALELGCPICREPDPIAFGLALANLLTACQSCGADLTVQTNHRSKTSARDLKAINQAYRNALLCMPPKPELLGQVTDQQFQSFVDDILQVLDREASRKLMQPLTRKQDSIFPEQPRLEAIAGLILNAMPSSDRQTRTNRHRRSLKLWTKILAALPEREAFALKQASHSWPGAIRSRFAHAYSCYERTTLRWRAFSRSTHHDGSPGFKCSKP